LEALEYIDADGRTVREPARVLLAHEGLVPSIHMTRALDCAHSWNAAQNCWTPDLDEWCQASRPGIYVAGDGSGIGGAEAARQRGELAALGIALHTGRLQAAQANELAAPVRAQLREQLRLRPMLDALYPPRADLFDPADDTIVCRCEELTAGDIRQAAKLGEPGPNQIKAYTRAGMGPCQGRQCGHTIAHILAKAHGRPAAEIGLQRVRPPLKPLTLAQLATLDLEDESR
jgi:NADPH-dependent 2,4-dienoyl-CoA reductase/sulfur reductase-like enzyme